MTELAPGTALVTGAARRIGRAIAEGLARDGWSVAVHYATSKADAEETVARITGAGGKAAALQADLADAADLTRLVAEAGKALGPVTLLVNNASLFDDDDVRTVTAESWDAHLAVNLRAPVLLARAFVEQLPPDSGAAIINMIDQRVWRLTPRFLSYTTAKAGLWAVTQTLAQALAPQVRVNGIGLGPTLGNTRQDPSDFDAQRRAVPLGTGPTFAEISNAIRFILETPSLTGQMLALDGGQHLAWQTPDAIGHE